MPYVRYTAEEVDYLKKKDPVLGTVMDRVGPIERLADTDLFSSVLHHIIGQQISTKAQTTIWNRMAAFYGPISPLTLKDASVDQLQSFGMTFRKAEYIRRFIDRILDGSFDLDAIAVMSDEEAIRSLAELDGIGVWTAEMILLFCLQRRDIFSWGDLAIQRGLRMVYHHRRITRPMFERYRRRYSPCGTVASLYLWAVAGGRAGDMRDYAPKKKTHR